MVRLLALITLASAVAVASADELVLQDGRTFKGTVTVKADSVVVDMAYGSLTFPRDEVVRVDFKDSPETDFGKRLARLSEDDVDGLFRLAQWAQENKLDDQAAQLFARVLKLRPDHAAARKACGFVHLDGKWVPFEKAVELARGKLAAGRNDALLKDVLPGLIEVAPKDRIESLYEMKGLAQLRSKKFVAAAKTFSDLAKSTTADESFRYATIADLLDENPDGMYPLSEPYPPQASLLGSGGKVLPAGPASLARPLVLEAALRERAKLEIKAGREQMDAAQQESDPDAALAKYMQADKFFDRADTLVDAIARSYHIEVARHRIAAIRKDTTSGAKRFDDALAALGKKDLPPQAYRALVLRLKRDLDNVQASLKTVLDVAKPYPRELTLEIQWAQQDLRKIDSMRDVLTTELDEKN